MCFKTNTGIPKQNPLSFPLHPYSIHLVNTTFGHEGEGVVAMRACVPNEQVSILHPNPYPNPDSDPDPDPCSNEMSAWKAAGHKGVHHVTHALCGWHKVNDIYETI